MADKPNDGSYKPRKSKKERVWTNTEMKYLALVLAEEKNQYAVRLETLALKKSSNNQVFDEISKDLIPPQNAFLTFHYSLSEKSVDLLRQLFFSSKKASRVVSLPPF